MTIVVAQAKQLEAEEAARALIDGISELEALLLFGSVARGDADKESDIDLIAVSSKPISSKVSAPYLVEHPGVSLVTHTWDSLERAREEDWSFFVHLREEGELLHGSGRLVDELDQVVTPSVERRRASLREEFQALDRFDDFERFSAGYAFPLAHFFTAARYTCMLDNTADGAIAFSRERAFEFFAERHPGVGDETALIATIWPFQARAQGRPIAAPFEADDEDRAREALWSVRRILCAAIDD